MPRMNPLRKKNRSSNNDRRDRQEQSTSFLRDLFFSTHQSSETSIAEDLLEVIYPVWETDILPTLISEFGRRSTLYAIFYAADTRKKEVILEIWDPNYIDTKPSQLFKFKGIVNVAKRLPISRSQAQIITLNNWD